MMTPNLLKELFEERAAIMQYDGKMSREDADCAAGLEQLKQMERYEWEQSRR